MTDKAKAEEFKKMNQNEDKPQEREVDGKKEYLDAPTGEWVSKGEIKKRKTNRDKEAKKAEKEAAKKDQPVKESKKKAQEEEELDPTKYRENRIKFLQNMRDNNENPYPHKFQKSMSVAEFRQ